MGDRRFVDYLNFKLSHKSGIDVSYDAENSFTREQLHEFQEKPSVGKKVLLLPWFWRMDTKVIKQYTEIMRDKKNTFVSVIVLEPEFLDHPEKVFPDTNVPFETLRCRQPLGRIQADQVLDARCALAEESISSKQRERILSLAGGHIGLLKRLFNIALQGDTLKMDTVLNDPAVKTDLLHLEFQLRALSMPTSKKIGLLRNDNTCALPLLKIFIQSHSEDFASTLTPAQQMLLDLFLSKKGVVISKEEIHRKMNTEGNYSIWAVYKTVSRLSNAITHKYRIRNVSGKGYMLVDRP